MKTDIHPDYKEARIVCACGNVIETRSTVEEIHVEICSNCHPFFTGKQKLIDTAGRVEKFRAKYGLAGESEEESETGESETGEGETGEGETGESETGEGETGEGGTGEPAIEASAGAAPVAEAAAGSKKSASKKGASKKAAKRTARKPAPKKDETEEATSEA